MLWRRVILCLNLILRTCAQIVTSSLNCVLRSHLQLESSIWARFIGGKLFSGAEVWDGCSMQLSLKICPTPKVQKS